MTIPRTTYFRTSHAISNLPHQAFWYRVPKHWTYTEVIAVTKVTIPTAARFATSNVRPMAIPPHQALQYHSSMQWIEATLAIEKLVGFRRRDLAVAMFILTVTTPDSDLGHWPRIATASLASERASRPHRSHLVPTHNTFQVRNISAKGGLGHVRAIGARSRSMTRQWTAGARPICAIRTWGN